MIAEIDMSFCNEVGEKVAAVMGTYRDRIGAALVANEGKLSVSIKLDFKDAEPGTELNVGISFVEGRIKDSMVFVIGEQQLELFNSAAEGF